MCKICIIANERTTLSATIQVKIIIEQIWHHWSGRILNTYFEIIFHNKSSAVKLV